LFPRFFQRWQIPWCFLHLDPRPRCLYNAIKSLLMSLVCVAGLLDSVLACNDSALTPSSLVLLAR
jgi:hypothetical protein